MKKPVMRTPSDTPRCVLYLRISRDAEGRELGVQRQEADLRAYAAQRGYVITAVYADNDRSASRSAKKPRPQFEQMLTDAAEDVFDVVLAYTASRITRRPAEFERLISIAEKYGTRFEHLRSPSFDLNTADGRQIAGILAYVDAAEADKVGERARRAKAQRRDAGIIDAGGTRLFGYRNRRNSALEPVEADLVRKVFAMVAAGSPVAAARRMLLAAGAVGPGGSSAWMATRMHSMLKNPIYSARMHNTAGDLIPAQGVVAIVDLDVWNAAQTRMAKRKIDDRAPRKEYLLSGKITCGRCGRRFIAQTGRTKPDGRVVAPSWRCGGNTLGNGANTNVRCVVSRKAEMIEAKVDRFVRAALSATPTISAPAPDAPNHREKIAEFDAAMTATQARMVDDPLNIGVYLDGLKRIASARQALVAEDAAVATRQTRQAVAVAADALEVWGDDSPANLEPRRRVLDALVGTIYVLPIPPGMRRVDRHTMIEITASGEPDAP